MGYFAGLCPKNVSANVSANALPENWDDCTLKGGQTPIGVGITNESPYGG
jgi:hypothetical protein